MSVAVIVRAQPTRIVQASPEAIEAARAVLAAGGLVAFPTETVYGLGADATNDAAVARLYAAKERPSFNPLIAHIAKLEDARRIAIFDDVALDLARAFWPGPLTLVLPSIADSSASGKVGALARAGLDTVAVRVPRHPVARALVNAFGRPVAAPSANRSGRVSPTSAAHVRADLDGRVDLIIDGGPTVIGLESTILSCVGDVTLLRPGALPREDIEHRLGHAVTAPAVPSQGASVPAPGMLASHYAPRATLRINARSVRAGEALLGFGPDLPEQAGLARAVLNLSTRSSLEEAAANLFAHLRALDATGADTIAAMPVPEHGLGTAINDRLRRAAAPRG